MSLFSPIYLALSCLLIAELRSIRHPRLAEQEAAVDQDRGSSHIARLRGGEKGDDRRYLGGIAEAAEGGRPALAFTHLGRLRVLVLANTPGRNRARCHRVDANAEPAEVESQTAGERLEPGFAGVVVGRQRVRDMGMNG